MKITVTNVDGKKELAETQIGIIVKEALEKYAKEGTQIEDVKLQEVSATISFKPKGSDEYFVGSVDHDGVTEMFSVIYDLEDKERDDNEKESLFAEEEKEILFSKDVDFEEIRSVFDEEELALTKNEVFGDMVLSRYDHTDGYEVVKVFQKIKGRSADKLIQEYSIKPK